MPALKLAICPDGEKGIGQNRSLTAPATNNIVIKGSFLRGNKEGNTKKASDQRKSMSCRAFESPCSKRTDEHCRSSRTLARSVDRVSSDKQGEIDMVLFSHSDAV